MYALCFNAYRDAELNKLVFFLWVERYLDLA